MIAFTPEEQLKHPAHSLYLIEASAGTGKTYTIANLYLRHILEGKQVKQILVVTFTNTATDELRGRIRAKLYDVLQRLEKDQACDDEFTAMLLEQCDKQAAKDQLELAVRSMDEASIFTIHGFCQLALKEFAFLSGQSFNLALSTDEDELLLPIAKDWWRRNIYQADPISYQVATQAWKNGINDFYRQIKTFLSREIRIIPERTKEINLAALTTDLATEYRQTRNTLWDLLNNNKSLLKAKGNSYYHKENLTSAFAAIDEWIVDAEKSVPPEALEALTLSYLKSKKAKNKHPLPEHDFFTQCETYWTLYLQLCQQRLTTLIHDAIGYIREQSALLKLEKQTLSFDDLLIQFNQALSSPSSKPLRDALRHRYPIALIDEFQDTDPIQYNIFKQLYIGQPQQTLYMIGDPKQAIYSFRGGDIYTYLQARQDVIQHHGTIYTLDTNWRSTPAMLRAANTLFSKSEKPFIYKSIEFQAVKTPESKTDHKILTINGEAVSPLNFWLSSNGEPLKSGKIKPLGKSAARQEIDTAVIQKIVELIKLGKKKQALLGDKPLQAKDIAVLVPSHSDATRLRQQLAAKGVSSVTAGKQTVFESNEAQALSLLLQTVLKPDDRTLLRQTLASHLLAYSYQEIYHYCNDDQQWMQWVDSFRNLHEQWLQAGFMSMFFSLLEKLHIAETVAKQDDTDRIMTNLLQLAELLQQASKEHVGIDALITWFEQKRENPRGESAELRLESDDELVKLVTLHASKGLEYGVVFLPYLWDLHLVNENERPIIYHDEKRNLIVDTGSSDIKAHHLLADRERLAEDARLVYVALTRAVACCYIAWGNIGRHHESCANNSALGYLLHGAQPAETLKSQKVSSLGHATNEEIYADLQTLVDASNNVISVSYINQVENNDFSGEMHPKSLSTPPLTFKTKSFNRSIENHWRISSFSALSRNIHHSSPYSETNQHDDILNFPAGKRTGLFLHSLFEQLDFQADIDAQVENLNQYLMPRYGLAPEEHHQTILKWTKEIIQTPLGSTNLTLADIPKNKRLNELEFHFSTSKNNTSIQQLNRRLAQQNKQVLQPLNSSDFHGLVHGFIDLVFEHKGKFYLADYKSNYLGDTLAGYDQAGMQKEINKRRYDLQYMLYSIALHRFLGNRKSDYTYEKHFGGVYYLFFRGMRIEDKTGVFFTRPTERFLEEVSRIFSVTTQPNL